MEKELLVHFKSQLENARQEILTELEKIGSRSELGENNFDADFPNYGDSLEDSAVEVADYTTNLSVEKKLEKGLADVDKALRKITDGTYGICHFCGQEIELERLKARPESTACVACKTKLKSGI